MNMIVRNFSVTISLLVFVLAACEAPHDNPFDPNSDKYSPEGEISGFVGSFYPPHFGIAQVTVMVPSLLRIASTDESGKFTFTNMPPGNYQLKFSRPGYTSDSMTVQLEPFQHLTTGDIFLNAIPVCLNPRVVSYHISDWGYVNDIDKYEIHFRTQAVDSDGERDIDSVFIRIEQAELSSPLIFDILNLDYYLIMPEMKMPYRSIECLLGKNVTFIVRDKAGFDSQLTVSSFVRVIESIPVAVAPRGLEIVGSNPTLQWQVNSPKYPCTFNVEVYYYLDHRRTTALLIWQAQGIDTLENSIQVTTALAAGSYYWVVWLVDEFGNQSRSKKAEFEVQ